MKRIAVVAGLLLAAAALAGVLRPEGARAVEAASADTVSVTGIGVARGVPDRASLTVGVESNGATAQVALAANGKEMERVIAAIRAAGGKDVSTAYVSLSPRTTPDGAADGYTASNSATATFALAGAGKAVDAAVAAGATTVYGPSFTSSDQAALSKKALGSAVADAKVRAETLAAAAGRTLGRITAMSESSTNAVPLFENAAASDAGTPIVASEEETTASVSVTFELR